MRSAQVIATPAPPMASTARQDSVPPLTGTRIPAARLGHARRGRERAWGPCASAAAAPLPALVGEALVQKSVRESSSWPQLSRRESSLRGRARVWGRRGQGIAIVPALSPTSFSGTGEGNGDPKHPGCHHTNPISPGQQTAVHRLHRDRFSCLTFDLHHAQAAKYHQPSYK